MIPSFQLPQQMINLSSWWNIVKFVSKSSEIQLQYCELRGSQGSNWTKYFMVCDTMYSGMLIEASENQQLPSSG
jgi:hypothetical protein